MKFPIGVLLANKEEAVVYKMNYATSDLLKIESFTVEGLGIHLHTQALRDGFYQKGSMPTHFWDPHSQAADIEREQFCKKLTQELKRIQHQEYFERLLILAESKMLGKVREHLDHHLFGNVVEVSKNVTNMPVSALRDYILPLL
jgi:protein required for attachment to host cells